MIEIQINDTIIIGGKQISLIDKTNDLDPSVIIPQRLGFVNLFDNDLFFKKGFRVEDRNKFHLEYCDLDKAFSLKFKANLSITGNFFFSGRVSIIFGEVKDCNWYRIDTNLKGYGNGNFLEFVEIE